eukprot:TRINITY_DN20889_c0_g2_i1.p1 TRINITY_DN20889_c0_g2~~TRINITY_DN20889_c0_g2_i1.p1  ORF type:complete len:598 (+),score=138.53 TRINITY_DN20889_c0_g2_i1:108-1796(+)
MDAAGRCLAASRRLGYGMRRSSALLARKELRNAQRAIDDTRRVIRGVILRDLSSWACPPAHEHIRARVVTAPTSPVDGTPPERYLLRETEQRDDDFKQDPRRNTTADENTAENAKTYKTENTEDTNVLLGFAAQHWKLKKYTFLAKNTAATQPRGLSPATTAATASSRQEGRTSPALRLGTRGDESTFAASIKMLLPRQGTIGKGVQDWENMLNHSWLWSTRSGKQPLHERVETLRTWGWYLVGDELTNHEEHGDEDTRSGDGKDHRPPSQAPAPLSRTKREEEDKTSPSAGNEKLPPKRALKPQLSDASTATCSSSARRAKATRLRPVSARDSQTVRKNFYNSLWKKGLYDFWGKVVKKLIVEHADKPLPYLWLEGGYRTGGDNLFNEACKDLNLHGLRDNEIANCFCKDYIVNLIVYDKIQAEIFLRAIHLDLVPYPSNEWIHDSDRAIEAGSYLDFHTKSIFDIDFSPLGFDAQIDSVDDLLEATREFCGHDEERILHHHYQEQAGTRYSNLLGYYVPQEERFVVDDDGGFVGIGEHTTLNDMEMRELEHELKFMDSRF